MLIAVIVIIAIVLYIFIGRCIGIYFSDNIPWNRLTEEQRGGQILVECFWPLALALLLFDGIQKAVRCGLLMTFDTLPRKLVKKICEIRDRRADEKFLRDGK